MAFDQALDLIASCIGVPYRAAGPEQRDERWRIRTPYLRPVALQGRTARLALDVRTRAT